MIDVLRDNLKEWDRLAVDLRDAGDDIAAARAATEAIKFLQGELLPSLSANRRAAVRRMRQTMSLSECAQALGVTDGRIAQITGA